jgi:hypothetical protein
MVFSIFVKQKIFTKHQRCQQAHIDPSFQSTIDAALQRFSALPDVACGAS